MLLYCKWIPFDQPLYIFLHADHWKHGQGMHVSDSQVCTAGEVRWGSQAGCPTKPTSDEAGLSCSCWLTLVGDLVVSDYIMVWGGRCRCYFGSVTDDEELVGRIICQRERMAPRPLIQEAPRGKQRKQEPIILQSILKNSILPFMLYFCQKIHNKPDG